jgi:hypothetical protein
VFILETYISARPISSTAAPSTRSRISTTDQLQSNAIGIVMSFSPSLKWLFSLLLFFVGSGKAQKILGLIPIPVSPIYLQRSAMHPSRRRALTGVLRIVGRTTAGGGARTHTILRSLDFESSASASSATPARESEATKPAAKLKRFRRD